MPQRKITDPRPATIEGDIAYIPLGLNAKGGFAIVDKEYAYLDKYRWTRKPMGRTAYATNKAGKLHQFILPPKDGLIVDHINRDGLDNRLSNLRYATRCQNQHNHGLKSTNKSGYIGVSYRKDIKKYDARMCHNGKYLYLGSFNTALEAAEARGKKATELRGEFAVLNGASA